MLVVARAGVPQASTEPLYKAALIPNRGQIPASFSLVGSSFDIHIMSVYIEFIVKGGFTIVHRRINITLPEDTVRLIDRLVAKGDRSRLIDEAVTHYVKATSRAELRKRLKAGAIRRAERDRQLAADWFMLDDEAWQRSGK